MRKCVVFDQTRSPDGFTAIKVMALMRIANISAITFMAVKPSGDLLYPTTLTQSPKNGGENDFLDDFQNRQIVDLRESGCGHRNAVAVGKGGPEPRGDPQTTKETTESGPAAAHHELRGGHRGEAQGNETRATRDGKPLNPHPTPPPP